MTTALPPSAPPPAADPAGGWPPPPPPPGPAPRPPLRRSRTDKVLGGVAGGLAEYTGIDALLWRVAAIALTFAGGSGVIIYLLLWLLMPPAPALQPGEVAPAAERRSGPRSPIPGVTVAALLIVVGIAVLLRQFTDIDLGPRAVLGAALLVVGVGLVVGAVTGMGRGAKGGLIGLGIVLTAALAVASTVHLPSHDVGDRTYRPLTAAAVERHYQHGVGDLTIDLTGVDVAGLDAPIVTTIDSGLGDVDVVVPRSADVQVTVHTGAGEVDVFGVSSEGGFFPGSSTAAWSGDADPEFRISISTRVGDVEVERG
jgi:phage shock protein PspC (stress-responsive transcriptional regulator)